VREEGGRRADEKIDSGTFAILTSRGNLLRLVREN